MSQENQNVLLEDFNIILSKIYITIFEGSGVSVQQFEHYKKSVEGIPSAYQEDPGGAVTYILQILEKYLKVHMDQIDYCQDVLQQYNDTVASINIPFYIKLLEYKALQNETSAEQRLKALEQCLDVMDDTCEVQERVFCVKEIIDYAIYQVGIYDLDKLREHSNKLSALVEERQAYFEGKRKLI